MSRLVTVETSHASVEGKATRSDRVTLTFIEVGQAKKREGGKKVERRVAEMTPRDLNGASWVRQ